MPRQSRAHASAPKKQTKQERLLEAAVRLFSRQGYAGTSVRDLGEALGIQPGSVYAHIDSKHTMLVQLVESGIDQYLDAVADLPGTPTEQLRQFVEAHVRVVAQDVNRARVVYHQWRHIQPPDRTRIVAKRYAYEHRLRDIIEAGVASGEFAADLDCPTAVRTVLGMVNWCPEWLPTDDSEPADLVGAGLAEIVLASVRIGHGAAHS
ncbi:TetR/AcrR family transcriptional regulator [Rhodococcus zopfii]|uniref:TetR/AcrR family transcriptional regulator n=1 Tax=Rhodococcus zopfii TaxID=43772 RepID=A0ABU3WVE0_9NOCA|nr:TetR/AcrR family transcriptional regulator [Rhodococcus zopfii]